MANLESFKDVRTVASVSALVAVGISSSYFLNEISKLKEELAEIKQHLIAIIPLVNPESSRRLNSVSEMVEVLGTRLAKAQEDIKIITHTHSAEEKPSKRVYQRLTQRNSAPSDPVVSPPSSGSFLARPHFITTTHEITDIDSDVAVMS